ncbi:MAG: PAS domain S-box protein [Candidatus Cloacimonetes bacterium]|nr:PAS domain S-box protein [Candidatus Cloacimonadota bacterium]
MAKEKLLVVDDNPELSENIKDIFEENNFYVKTASSGKEAIKLSKKDKFRIALMDLKLPDYDGQELIKKLEEIIPCMEYIIITGYASKDTAKKAVSDEKIISYEEKPLDFDLLLDIIQQAIKRQKAEEELCKSENRYREIFENVQDVFYEVTYDGVIVDASPSIETLSNGQYKREDVIGKQITELYANPDDRKEFLKALEEKGNLTDYEIMLENRDRTLIPCSISAQIRYNEKGKPEKIISTIRDMTERKKAEEKLRKSEARFRSYIENSPEGVFITDEKGKYVAVNKAATTITGYSKEDLLQMNFIDLIPPEYKGKAKKAHQSLIKEGEMTLEIPFIKKDGSRHHWFVSAVDISENMFLGFVHDITTLKKTEENLKLAFESTIEVIADILEVRDAYTAGHQRRVSQLAVEIAKEMGIEGSKRKGIEVASNIHDLGKIIVPAQILSKPTQLTDLEFSYIMQHPVVGHQLLKNVNFPWPIADIVHQHHERLDGSGYPQGLKGEDIMLEAQILAVADVVEAMSSQRPYRPALGIKAALEEVEKHKGKKYNPEVVDACVKVINSDFEFMEVKSTVLASKK